MLPLQRIWAHENYISDFQPITYICPVINYRKNVCYVGLWMSLIDTELLFLVSFALLKKVVFFGIRTQKSECI